MTEIYVFIEIEKNSNLKYEYDKNVWKLDRILDDFYYPFAYGFIPNTLAEDGDQADVLVISNQVLSRGSLLICTIIGIIFMEDEKGIDNKIIVKPCDEDITASHVDIENLIHFFSNYKKKEQNKWSKVYGYDNAEVATQYYKLAVSKFLLKQ